MKSSGSLVSAGFNALKYVAKFVRFNAKSRVSTVKMDKPVKLLQSDTGSNQSDYEGVIMATAIISSQPRPQWFDLRFQEDSRKIRCDCVVCKRPMWFPKSKAGKYLTCGGECAQKRRSDKESLRIRLCATCGCKFTPRQSQLDNGIGTVCSQKCNIATHVAVNSVEAQKKAKSSWKKRNAISPIVKSGPENPAWTGGRAATYQRQRISGKIRIYSANRRRSKGTGKLSAGIAKKLGDLQRWCCAICECSIKDYYEIDHVQPLARGGANVDSNVQLLCKPCNRRKLARDPIEYMQSLGRLL